jgi:hypothetical protein
VTRRVSMASLAVLLFASAGRADDRQACVDAADTGQTLRDQGKLVEARESFVACSRDACPSIVAAHCATWLSDVDREIATVTFRATDASGKELVDVQVSIDGALRLRSIDGRAMRINPGVHTIRFSHADAADVDKEVVVHAGEKVRLIEVRIGGPAPQKTAGALLVAPTDADSAPHGGFRFPAFAVASLGVGAASFIGMGVLVGTTASDVNHLRATCAGSCSSSDVSSANTRIVLANVAMGVGIAAIAAAGVSLVVVNLGHPDDPARQAWFLRGGFGTVEVAGSF